MKQGTGQRSAEVGQRAFGCRICGDSVTFTITVIVLVITVFLSSYGHESNRKC